MIYITDGAMLDGVLDPALRALLTTRRDQLLADAAIKGFVLECRAAGGKTFYLRYQDQHGRQKQHRIAGYGDAPIGSHPRWRPPRRQSDCSRRAMPQ